jgi:hypothetical protein
MNLAAVIKRNGKKLLWKKMSGSNGVYDPITRTVVNAVQPEVTIYGVLDGFGSEISQLRAEQFRKGELNRSGSLRILTTSPVYDGDYVTVDDVTYTAFYQKAIWVKSKIVLYEVLVTK